MSTRTKNKKIILNQSGSALLITLLLISILTGLAVNFAYEVYIGTSALSNWSNAQRASLLAKSGQALAASHLMKMDEVPYTYPGEFLMPVEKDFDSNSSLTLKLEDENAKFNINNIIYPNGRTNERALSSLKKLFEYLNINPVLAMAIADWIDPDTVPRAGGFEKDAKNSYLWNTEELKFIKRIDKEALDTITPFITVYGDKKININTAKLPVLVSLSNEMTETLAKKVIYYREGTPFEDKNSIVNISGMESIGISIQSNITVKSSGFRIIATGTVNEITRIIESVTDISMKILHWREV